MAHVGTGGRVIEQAITVTSILTLVGASIATYQLITIRRRLDGPILRTKDIGEIIVEHIAAGALWLTLLFAWIVIREYAGPFVGDTRWIILGLVVMIAVIVWGFVIRAHRWWLNVEGEA